MSDNISASPAVVVLPDAEAIAARGAREFERLASRALSRAPVFRVALAGGSTPRRLYSLLGRPPLSDTIAWERVHFFWGDERYVPRDHPESNFRMAREAMFEPLSINADNLHPIPAPSPGRTAANLPELEAAALAYQDDIARAFGVGAAGPPPSFDLVFLGLGPDCHTASLFPHDAPIRETSRWVLPVASAPKPPAARVTLTPLILNSAARVLFLVAGADKAHALSVVLDGPNDPVSYPAQAICPKGTGAQPNTAVTWLIDRAAAARLNRSPSRGR